MGQNAILECFDGTSFEQKGANASGNGLGPVMVSRNGRDVIGGMADLWLNKEGRPGAAFLGICGPGLREDA